MFLFEYGYAFLKTKKASLKSTFNKRKLRLTLMAGAEGLEPSARGFGGTVENSKPHR